MKTKHDASGGGGISVTVRYAARHARRSFAGTLPAAFLVGTVGQMAQLRARYADLISSVVVDMRFYNDFDHEKAKLLHKRYPGNLSGGEQQRVGIARSLASGA